MTNLSPAAKTVLDAYWQAPLSNKASVVAAIRAAADQVISSISPPCEDFDEYAQGFLAAHTKYRAELLAIATELEGQ